MADWIPFDLDSLVERDKKIKELEERVAALENRLNAAVAKRLILEDPSNSQWIK